MSECDTIGRSVPSKEKAILIANYLQIPVENKKITFVGSARSCAMSGARFLIISECLAILKEKERKEKNLGEEKENRKQLCEERGKSESGM